LLDGFLPGLPKELPFPAALALLQVAGRRCPFPCRCAPRPLRCPPGVSSVFDDCGCCQVCARQLNEDCDKLSPCDPHKGLECHFGADPLANQGICWGKEQEGRTCEYNGRIYQNGENFQPSCKHQCTCIDGAVGCQPLCPLELPLASLGCPSPRLLKIPGQCCKKFVCSKGSKKYKGVTLEAQAGLVQPFFQDQDTKQERKCLAQTTHWSPCSKSCGFGISTRINSNNSQCKLIKETRLCQVRPCEFWVRNGVSNN
uniref:CCN family member 1 n=1 Tax=Naja naja TaxID=35670 RepID=A0A8C6XGK1_NAJNA